MQPGHCVPRSVLQLGHTVDMVRVRRGPAYVLPFVHFDHHRLWRYLWVPKWNLRGVFPRRRDKAFGIGDRC